jgi:hypothetical protein
MKNLTEALFYLTEQSLARGFNGHLGDFNISLCEDDKTISIWAYYELDVPLMAHVELPQPVDPTTFDPAPYYREAQDFAAALNFSAAKH